MTSSQLIILSFGYLYFFLDKVQNKLKTKCLDRVQIKLNKSSNNVIAHCDTILDLEIVFYQIYCSDYSQWQTFAPPVHSKWQTFALHWQTLALR